MLKFTLTAPLQSWGIEKINGGDYFPTASKPTKSGIVGLIGCVMGLERDNPRLKDIYDNLMVYAYSYPNDGIMTDFHVISANEDRPQYLANGKNTERSARQGIVTHRSYIQGGRFDVIIDGEESLLTEIAKAFRDPYWTPYLGRKCCAVSEPILPKFIDKIGSKFEQI